MSFDFGIVNYNGGEALSACVESILGLEGGPVRVFVFDNASGDGSAQEAARRFPGITIIASDRNLGYAGALNGMLPRMTADVVVLCNMDLRFDRRWLREVDETLRQNPGVDGVTTLVLEMTDPPVVNSAGIRFYADLHPQNVGSGLPYRPGSFHSGEVVGGYGAVMCFRRTSISDLRFDDDYFLFFEETDFFLRFALLGRRLIFVPTAIIYHHRSLSTGRYSLLKLFYGERNRVTTIFKLLPVWYWPVSLGYSLRRLATLRKKTPPRSGGGAGPVANPAAIIWTILRAWTAAVLRLPATLRKRSAFWNGTSATPGDALALLRKNALGTRELTIR